MQPISNNSTIAIMNPTQKNTPFLGENNNIPTLNSRGEAINYIKLLTQGQDSCQFDVENTIGELKSRIEIPLNILEF